MWQGNMFGAPKRLGTWGDILIELARELGDCPDKDKTQWYKTLLGMLFGTLPETRTMIKAILKRNDVDYSVKLVERLFTLDSVLAPDTMGRQLRDVRKLLIDTGEISIQRPFKVRESFQDLLYEAEESVGNYHSGIEIRFGQKLKDRFENYLWEENKRIEVNGKVIRPDFLCEKLTLSIEIDSLEFHQDRHSFSHDRKKSRLMQMAGYYHLQFSGPELSIFGGVVSALDEIAFFIQHRKLDQ